jgi:hypothetical protein
VELKPETAALAPKAGPVAGHAEVLAGESAIDEINTGGTVSPPSRCSKPFSVGASSDSDQVSASSAKCGRVHLANVGEALTVGPVTLKNAQAPGVVLGLQDCLNASSFEADLEAAGARKERYRTHSKS